MSLFWASGSPWILPKGFSWWSPIPVITPCFQHLPVVSGECIVNYKLMIFRSTCMSFSTHTGWFALVCNHCSLQNTGRRVIIITAILAMGNGDSEAECLGKGAPWLGGREGCGGPGEAAYCSALRAGPRGCVVFLRRSRLLFFHHATGSSATRDLLITEGRHNNVFLSPFKGSSSTTWKEVRDGEALYAFSMEPLNGVTEGPKGVQSFPSGARSSLTWKDNSALPPFPYV